MKVQDLMTCDVKSCGPDDRMNMPAQIMWDEDCGCVPVVDRDRKVVAMITDRDICMAAYIQGASLKELRVSSAMSRQVLSCKPEDELAIAQRTMRLNQVRRLPVVDADGRLAGIISLSDVGREAERERFSNSWREVSDSEVVETLASVSEPRLTNPLAQAA
jgi:CBS domain-containing protein